MAIRWGIIAPGGIGHKFAKGLEAVPDAFLAAVASRDAGRADEFARQYTKPGREAVRAYSSYRELAEDPDIDIVYIASPHPFHMEHAILCAENGKAILCEKPFAVNADQAAEIISSVRKHKVFCMEAMWSRYLPALAHVKSEIDKGTLGTLRMIRADLSFSADADPDNRLLNPRLAGGALLDVGIYVLSLSSFFMGSLPEEVTGLCEKGPTGVDIQEAISCRWADGRIASLSCGVQTPGPVTMDIIGTKASVSIPRLFFTSETCDFISPNGLKTFTQRHLSNGYEYEAIEAGRCLAKGLLESPAMTLDETLGLAKIMDALRSDWGIRYPFE